MKQLKLQKIESYLLELNCSVSLTYSLSPKHV